MSVRLLTAAVLATWSTPAAASITLLGGGPPGSIVEAIAAAVPGVLPPGTSMIVEKPVAGSDPLAALERGEVAAALLHGDTFRMAARRSPAIADLEFFPLRRACFVMLVPLGRRDGATAVLASSATAEGGAIDIGAAGSLTAGSWAVLSAAHPALSQVRTETRGGMRAVARLLNQQVSAVLLSSLEIVPGDIVTNAVIDGLARIIPVNDDSLWRSAAAVDLGYQRRRLTVEDAKGGDPELSDAALCTDLGIAVSDAAAPGISEAIATAASAKRLSGEPRSLLDRMSGIWRHSVEDVTDLIGNVRVKAGQAAQGLVPGWFDDP
ncbi:hypothetical protein N825_33160 [Skermanella stibiiresistens SB22]|uniref:SsuA/THI5-like domain-containing protein n=1 Tax=Skermanella stibiiresistens SB22 TaxID=1385369 RepID=W9H3K7_9PROT|nr:hypothetical protein [Skermanella stibiiresistens]EWY40780.1 hypothetical protein N825_33160 [Skermanella stibiiresistens SB22]